LKSVAEKIIEKCEVERVKGIEPSYGVWKTPVLPLNYTRVRSEACNQPGEYPNDNAHACLVNRWQLNFTREFAASDRRSGD
jgi:hypothetical protein